MEAEEDSKEREGEKNAGRLRSVEGKSGFPGLRQGAFYEIVVLRRTEEVNWRERSKRGASGKPVALLSNWKKIESDPSQCGLQGLHFLHVPRLHPFYSITTSFT